MAGCSEGTLYNHFADKQDLFVVCTIERNPGAVDALLALPSRAGTATVESVLHETLSALADLHSQLVPVLASLWSDPALMARHKEFVHSQLPEPMRGGPVPIVADYLRAEQELGRIRPDVDPVMVATMLLAIPFADAIGRHSGFAADPPDRDTYLSAALGTIMTGLAPSPTKKTKRP